MMLLKNHPPALPFLFLTEMWERYGFYVVQGLLVLYMTKAAGLSDDMTYTIMGVFSALVYISPIAGGIVADRLLGFRTAILWGGILLSIGYAMLTLSWPPGFYLALATIIVGNGLLKPNISSLLGSLYTMDDPRRESGFTIFYIGINIGALLAGVSSGYIKDHFGWHASFGLASGGLIIGLLIFVAGLQKLVALQPAFVNSRFHMLIKINVLSCCVLAIALVSLLLQSTLLAKWLLPIVGCVLLASLLLMTARQTFDVRTRLLTLTALILSSLIFWTIYLQMFFSFNLFIDRLIYKPYNIPTTAFYAIESVFVILLGPILAWLWYNLNRSDRNISSFLKFVLAIVFAGLGALTLAISTYFPNAQHLINPLWIVLSYFLIALGEMLLSPIGLSAVTTLAPRHLVGMMMGIWFVALGFGGQFAGWLAKLSNIPDNTELAMQVIIYRTAFAEYALIAFSVAAALFVIHLILMKILKIG